MAQKDFMSKEEFIESGLLRKYVLGELNRAGEEEVETYLNLYPELRQELDFMQKSLDRMNISRPERHPSRSSPDAEQGNQDQATMNAKSTVLWPLLACAALIGYFFWSNLQLKKDLHKSQMDYISLATECDRKEEARAELLELYQSPATHQYIIEADELQPKSTVVLHHNAEKKYAELSSHSLPPLPEKKCYQLWADVDGEMVSVALISWRNHAQKRIDYHDDVASYNITVESDGGSKHPTLDALVGSVALID